MRVPVGFYKGLTLWLDPATELMFYAGLYEAETTKWLADEGKSMRSLVDVGAGCGELSMWALSKRQVERVLAYDASPERWPIFEKNLAANGFTSDGRLHMVRGFFLGNDDADVTLTMLRELPEPVLVRIDVDGGEVEIVDRLRGLLESKDLRFLIETHSEELHVDCRKVLEAHRYRVSDIIPACWRFLIPERRPVGFNQWLVAEREGREGREA